MMRAVHTGASRRSAATSRSRVHPLGFNTDTVVDDVLIIANGRLVTHQPADHTTDLETLFLDLTTRGRDGKDRHVNAPAR